MTNSTSEAKGDDGSGRGTHCSNCGVLWKEHPYACVIKKDDKAEAKGDEGLPEFESIDAPVVIGLVAQGHIKTIEGLLDKGVGWDAIAKQIGWEKVTAMDWYIGYLRHRRTRAAAGHSEAVEALAEIRDVLTWETHERVSEEDVKAAIGRALEIIEEATK